MRRPSTGMTLGLSLCAFGGHAAAQCGPGWLPSGNFPGMDSRVRVLCSHDDGTGPALYAGGEFLAAGGAPASRVARWTGDEWEPLGEGLDGPVLAMASWDDDTTDGQPAKLYVGGYFLNAGGAPAARMACWDGAAWNALGAGMNSAVHGLTTFDPDGPGPRGVELIAVGNFLTAGGVMARGVAAWNGAAWGALGMGYGGQAYAATAFDPDGAGLGAPMLFVGGIHPTSCVRAWNGSAWQNFGALLGSDIVLSLGTYDPDGGGAQAAQLFVGGALDPDGEAPTSLARWGNGDWVLMDAPAGLPLTFETYDTDGPGPLPPSLLTGGPDGIGMWTAAGWAPFDQANEIYTLRVFDFDESGPLPPVLVVGGAFDYTSGGQALRVARWSALTPPPVFTESPMDTGACLGAPLRLSAYHASLAPATYRWRKDGVPLADGATPSGSIVEGATRARLTITDTSAADIGAYDCVATSACGAAISAPAFANVGQGDQDFNNDGLYPDAADLFDFLSVFGGGTCPTGGCDSLDYNGDTLFPDTTDLETFFSVFAGGSC